MLLSHRRVVILLLLFYVSRTVKCCKPEEFKHIKITEKLAPLSSKTDKWKETSIYYITAVINKPLVIANEDISICRVKVQEYEQQLLALADAIEIHLHNIPVLRNGDIQNLDIYRVSLEDNNIERIEPGVFQNLRILSVVNLGDNYITEIPAGVFNIQTLKGIDLSNNDIEHIATNAFDNLSNLEEIYLGYNNLREWNPEWFLNTLHLKHIQVGYNELENLPENAFGNFKSSIEKIDLSHNGITTLHVSLFENAPKLKNLNLSFNKLKCFGEDILKVLPKGLTLDILSNESLGCTCLNNIQKFSLENHLFSEDTSSQLVRYIQVICNEEVLEKRKH